MDIIEKIFKTAIVIIWILIVLVVIGLLGLIISILI